MMKQHKRGMVDVSIKKDTKRRAVAASTLVLGPAAYKGLVEGRSPKGDVLETAKVAAILAAKKIHEFIPHCHPLLINQVLVDFHLDKKNKSVTSTVEVNYIGKTGVEMEALTAASIASLTIYDMMKWADKGMVIKETKLLHKSGGKSGTFKRNR